MRIPTRFLAAASIAALSLFAGSAMAQEKLIIGTRAGEATALTAATS